MKSVRLCSRNGLIVNSSVIISTGPVWYFQSSISDMVVAGAFAALFFLLRFKCSIPIVQVNKCEASPGNRVKVRMRRYDIDSSRA